MRRISTLLVVLTVIGVLAAPAGAGAPVPEFLDQFQAQTFDGNDGSLDYNGPWAEIGEQNGPESGVVRVWDHEYCDGAYCLKIGGNEGEAAGRGADRAVDLTNAIEAKLRFEFGRQLLAAESQATAVVQVSPDGGDTWTTLKTISLDKDDWWVKFPTTLFITDFATADTVIRFKIETAVDLHAYWLIDNFAVEATFPEPPVTTTTTTSPPPTTTTTTSPPPTTTTTTSPPLTTTTGPPLTTTTTTTAIVEPQITTTTQPRTTTTIDPQEMIELVPNTPDESEATTTIAPVDPWSDASPEVLDTMVHKTALAMPNMSTPTAMPDSDVTGETTAVHHPEPIEALAAEFFTESGSFGENLFPSIALGAVIAVVSLIGIGSRKED